MTNEKGIIKYSEGGIELIQHFIHPHPLTLLSLDREAGTSIYCKFCWDKVSPGTPCYGCKKEGCKDDGQFYIHKSCAELPQQLQHPFHPKHPLTLMLKETIKCDSCGRRAPYFQYKYNCSRCKFHLCKKCASLPLTTKLDIHDHKLTLMRKSTQFTCDHCEKEGKGMFYFCGMATCSFMVHPECTLSVPLVEQPLIIEAKIHQDHPLILAKKLNSFTCDACGKEGRGMFYFCAECSFVFHLQCASSPLDIKVIRHEHPLSLNIYSHLLAPATNLPLRLHGVCQLCVNKVDTDYMFYYCSTCDFAAHLFCATSKDERDHEEHGTDQESIDMLPFVVKKLKPGVDGSEIAIEIKHFSHEHDLTLISKSGIKDRCNACMRHIFTPYYACTQCGIFFLHKFCAELRRRKKFPIIHEHALELLPESPYSSKGYFGCDICDFECKGFTYNCKECTFDIDVHCGLLPHNYFTHDSHEHGLILFGSQEGRKCNHCNSNDQDILFCCADCEFALDFKCLTLPQKVWNEQVHEHPFTLCYVQEDDSGEYYCDFCEQKRDPRYWYYDCADCNYVAHLDCVLENKINVSEPDLGKFRGRIFP